MQKCCRSSKQTRLSFTEYYNRISSYCRVPRQALVCFVFFRNSSTSRCSSAGRLFPDWRSRVYFLHVNKATASQHVISGAQVWTWRVASQKALLNMNAHFCCSVRWALANVTLRSSTESSIPVIFQKLPRVFSFLFFSPSFVCGDLSTWMCQIKCSILDHGQFNIIWWITVASSDWRNNRNKR